MKRLIMLMSMLSLCSLNITRVNAQKVYSVTSGEMIFSMSTVELTDDFLSVYPEAGISNTNLRWTAFFHLSHNWHIDFTDNIGMITGLGIRNVGLITHETLPAVVAITGTDYNGEYRDYKIIRRTYTAGIPLMFKLGSFQKHVYFFGGGEFELAFHYKEKFWSDTHSRTGSKTKYTEWFGNQVPAFLPSVMGGVQLPGGFHVKFKYYLDDFLNNSYGRQNSSNYAVSDLRRYESSQVFYFSVSWQFNTGYLSKKEWQSETSVASL